MFKESYHLNTDLISELTVDSFSNPEAPTAMQTAGVHPLVVL